MYIDKPEISEFQDANDVLSIKPKKSLSCDLCDLKSEDEIILKFHKRDKQDDFSKSILHKPKRKNKVIDNSEEEMEVKDGVQLFSDIGIESPKVCEVCWQELKQNFSLLKT